eukprot:TRINITY_DN29733_c0_g1_i1.p1 TRINITY_DN29733_c0_g1~~TRINITY_DN29733_c0_g1_i1.p1  ORF type:complete len:184 (+),score=42.29 TRINITY_DN29733_c0_g1_i1:58-609(+)
MALTRYEYKDFQEEEKPGRFYSNQSQKDRLHQEFRKNKNPSTEWRQELAEELQVPVKKVHMWFGAKRQKVKLAQEKKLRSSPVGKVSIHPSARLLLNNTLRHHMIFKMHLNPREPKHAIAKPSGYYEPVTKPSEPLYSLSYPTEPKVSPYSDVYTNQEKEREALDKLDVNDIVKHFFKPWEEV